MGVGWWNAGKGVKEGASGLVIEQCIICLFFGHESRCVRGSKELRRRGCRGGHRVWCGGGVDLRERSKEVQAGE